jgi:LysM repeat protein
MFRLAVISRALLLGLLLGFLAAGCDLFDRSKTSEETEAHYLDGVTAKKLLDYTGAISHFQNALKVNPNSGAAHRELGLLYDSQKNDFVTALYHYNRYRELRRQETNPVVDGRIFHCKVMLAREYASYLDRQQNQSELEDTRRKLIERNSEVEMLKLQLAGLTSATNAVAQLSPRPALQGTNAQQMLQSLTNSSGRSMAGAASPTNKPGITTPPVVPAASTRVYVVKSGDTLARIARQYGFSVDEVRALNPRIDPNRMRVGQMVTLPNK